MHTEEIEKKITKRLLALRTNSDRCLNIKSTNRRLVLLPSSLSTSNGCGREFHLQNRDDTSAISDFIQHLPIVTTKTPGHDRLIGKTNFVYTNVKAKPGKFTPYSQRVLAA